MRTIVVGVDGSADSRAAVEWAAGIASAMGGRVVAVHAVGMLEHERDDPEGRHLLPDLEAWTAGLDALPPEQHDRRLVPGDPVTALLRVADEQGADLVVVGTRGHSAPGRVPIGSTSLQLAERCACALTIVPRGAH